MSRIVKSKTLKKAEPVSPTSTAYIALPATTATKAAVKEIIKKVKSSPSTSKKLQLVILNFIEKQLNDI